MKLIVHEATVLDVDGQFQGRCSALDFSGSLRPPEAAALADIEQHLTDKRLITHRSGRYSYRVVHADGTPPLREAGTPPHVRVARASGEAAARLERAPDGRG